MPIVLFLPFSWLAWWRTFVHAQRYRQGHSTVGRAVLEPALVGLVIALAILSRGIASKPRDAFPYIAVYGGGAIIAGCIIGVVLSISGAIALKVGMKLTEDSAE